MSVLLTQIRLYAVEWIEKLPKNTFFHLSELYKYLKYNFPNECDEAGITGDGHEPKYKKEARFAVLGCKHRKVISDGGKRGQWRRL